VKRAAAAAATDERKARPEAYGWASVAEQPLCAALLWDGRDGRRARGTGRREGHRARGKGRRERVYLRQRFGMRERVGSTGARARRERGREEAELERVRRGARGGLGDED
jgi:hypothetical protein